MPSEPDPPRSPDPRDLPLHLQQTQVGSLSSPAGFGLGAEAPAAIAGYADLVELHRGGQGIVYRARQESTRRSVAIKVLRDGAQADSAARKRFQREVEIIAQLEHPHIVSVFDSGLTATGQPFFVMEYVRGQELDRFVRERDLGVDELLRLFCVVLEAAHHAHQRGVVHRDLKPSNILIDETGMPRLVDFGLARPLDGRGDSFASLTGQVLGTMAYMSPEQVRADPAIDARTDVYALGVILYEMLTGSSPYPASSQILDILRHIAETAPRAPKRAWSTNGVRRRSQTGRRVAATRCPIDGELETIVLKAMAKEPQRRYASAHDFAADLGRHLAGLPIAARRDSSWYVLRKRVGRNRRTLAVTAVAIVVLVAAWWLVPRPRAAGGRTALDPAAVAQYAAAEARYAETRAQLQSALDARIGAGEVMLDAVTQESLRIVADAVAQLRAALADDPANPELRRLLLGTYDRELSLLQRIATLPGT